MDEVSAQNLFCLLIVYHAFQAFLVSLLFHFSLLEHIREFNFCEGNFDRYNSFVVIKYIDLIDCYDVN